MKTKEKISIKKFEVWGAAGGRAIVKKHGRKYMSQLSKRYWNSPAGKARRAKKNKNARTK